MRISETITNDFNYENETRSKVKIKKDAKKHVKMGDRRDTKNFKG